jgi:glycosyltransferase involved in cell wall biosynthesis
MTGERATISLCMIVRDEERFLARCLGAARSYVDEICVVDTGSTDRTVEIARSFGARVRTIAWPSSFAKARNASLDMATGDWILFLDADEVLRAETAAPLRAIADNPRIAAAHLRVANHYDGGKRIDCLILRLFRRAPEHRFTGAIHEQVLDGVLATAAKTGQSIVETTITIDHYGYAEDVRSAKKKDERNRVLFETAVREEPANAYLWFKYADFLRRFDDAGPVIAALKRTLELLDGRSAGFARAQTYGAEAAALLALEELKLERPAEAARTLARGRERYEPTATFLWVEGHAALLHERWADALASFEACRAMDGRHQHIPAQPGITGGRALFGIARARLGLGETQKAGDLFLAGAAAHPDVRDLVVAAAQVEASRGKLQDALKRSMEWLATHPEETELWALGARILTKLGLTQRAETWAARAASPTAAPRPAVART